ncbi:endonuclease domain-containing protein [Pseudonocardia oroxyli]|uniref:DUF559 domain-containing protein n=1 Tax=Pseudonocardia oroxyli TaxID=366584 RepID=A0A1G7DHN2_PSEOR|nr:DUF559 domain-containing protein [Pseudonocardia oroxyli]SDE51064.1 Protein of unknown function [Pseudonocardia oroxyli]
MLTTEVPGWPAVFRGSWAVRAGLVTRRHLEGPRFVRVFPDVHVPAGGALDLRLRSHAAYLHMQTRGVLSGYAAAALHGAACAPTVDVLPDITVPGGGFRAPDGLRLHRETLSEGEVIEIDGLAVTSPERTAFDLARWAASLNEAVAAVDRLANVARFPPAAILRLNERHPAMRGCARLPEVVDLADHRSGSRPETLLRLLLVQSGLPRPELQWVVQDVVAKEAVWVDLAYPRQQVGIEYEGAPHVEAAQVLRDIARTTMLTDKGWRMLRFTKNDVFRRPEYVVTTVGRALRTSR